MYRMKSIVWISAGVIIGWFISQIIMAERRRAERTISDEEE